MWLLFAHLGGLYIGVTLLFLIVMLSGKDETIKASRECYGAFIVSLVCLCWGPLFFLCTIGQSELAGRLIDFVSRKRIQNKEEENSLIRRLEERGF